jgi:hypothetical protein
LLNYWPKLIEVCLVAGLDLQSLPAHKFEILAPVEIHNPVDLRFILYDRSITVVHDSKSELETMVVKQDFIFGRKLTRLSVDRDVRLLTIVEFLKALHRVDGHNYVA